MASRAPSLVTWTLVTLGLLSQVLCQQQEALLRVDDDLGHHPLAFEEAVSVKKYQLPDRVI